MNLYESGVKFISDVFDKDGKHILMITFVINMVLLCSLSVIMD